MLFFFHMTLASLFFGVHIFLTQLGANQLQTSELISGHGKPAGKPGLVPLFNAWLVSRWVPESPTFLQHQATQRRRHELSHVQLILIIFFNSLICKLHQVAKFHSTWVDFKSSSLGTSWDQLAFMYDSISCFGSCSGLAG